MKRFHVTPIACLFALLATTCWGQNKEWDRRFGGSNFDLLRGLRQTTDGGYILGGSSYSGISGDKTQATRGGYDYWLVKVNSSGTKQWDKRFGGSQSDYGQAVQQTSDGGYIMAGYSLSGMDGDKTQASRGGRDFWVVKVDANGNKQWDRRFGGSGQDYCTAIIEATTGGYLLAGYSNSGADGDKGQASRGGYDFWIVRLYSNGDMAWDRRFGGSGDDYCFDVKQTSDGGFILFGDSDSPISGDKTQGTQGEVDYWMVKVSSMGLYQWDKRFGGVANDFGNSVQQTSDGGYILGGHSWSGPSGDKTEGSRGFADYWIVKTDASGNKQWDRRFGGDDTDEMGLVRQTSDGGYIVAGNSRSSASGDKTQASQGGHDFWVVKLNASGSKEWDRRFGGSGEEPLLAVQQTSDGGYILGGNSSSGISGDKTESLRGERDYWIVKLSGTPTPTVQRWDALQPITGYTSGRWAFLTAWNLTTGGFEASGSWRRGTQQWDHDATDYNQWIARFVYDQASMQTRALAWYYRQVHVQ